MALRTLRQATTPSRSWRGDVLAAVDAAGRERFAYCGLSLGGMIGQWLGAHCRRRIERLVLANTSPRVADPSLFETRRATVLEAGNGRHRGRGDAAVLFRAHAGQREPVGGIRFGRVLLATDPVGYAGCCAAIRDMDHRPLLGRDSSRRRW